MQLRLLFVFLFVLVVFHAFSRQSAFNSAVIVPEIGVESSSLTLNSNEQPFFSVDADNLKTTEPKIAFSLEAYERISVTIDPALSLKNATFTVYNLFGEVVLKRRIAEHQFAVEISSLQKGIYILVIFTDSAQLSRKFIKK